SSSDETTTTAAGTTTTVEVTTTATTAPTTTTPASTAPATTVTCSPIGGVGEVNVDFPNKMSGLVGQDIRAGGHDCFERVVIELAAGQSSGSPSVFPGYRVRYEDKPILDSPRGEPVGVAGAAVLVVAVAAWMPDMSGNGYKGPTDITPVNVKAIKQMVQIENFEGLTQWAIGLDAKRSFKVSTLTAPDRLVIDIQTKP
ncbi:MAG TPA: hypothetical protein VF855_05980, partial [Acidimicrobiales bacterium]